MRVASLRQACPDDLAALGTVAYATGFFGASAARYFPDQRLFADLWVRPYLRLTPAGLLAEDAAGPLGYVLGSSSGRAYRRALAATLAQAVLPGLLRGRYPQLRGSLPYLLRLARYPGREADAARFPAHLHLNVLARARGQGAGEALLRGYLAALSEMGVPGVQLSTTHENQAALGLYRKLGFEVLLEYSSPLWRPWLGRDAEHLVLGLELSESERGTRTRRGRAR